MGFLNRSWGLHGHFSHILLEQLAVLLLGQQIHECILVAGVEKIELAVETGAVLVADMSYQF